MMKLIAMGIACMLSGVGVGANAQDTTKTQEPIKTAMAMKEGMPMKDGMGMKEGMPMKDGMGMKEGMPMKDGAMMMDMMKMSDANGDGMVSKKEFMKHHESMFAKMKKGSNGMVNIKDMQTMHDAMPMKK